MTYYLYSPTKLVKVIVASNDDEAMDKAHTVKLEKNVQYDLFTKNNWVGTIFIASSREANSTPA